MADTNGGSSGAGGWIVTGALIIVIGLIAIFVWPGYGRQIENTNDNGQPTQINVQIPVPGSGSDDAVDNQGAGSSAQ